MTGELTQARPESDIQIGINISLVTPCHIQFRSDIDFTRQSIREMLAIKKECSGRWET